MMPEQPVVRCRQIGAFGNRSVVGEEHFISLSETVLQKRDAKGRQFKPVLIATFRLENS